MAISISVIICTYGRAASLEALLGCLAVQDYACFETLIVDGNGNASPAREVVGKFRRESGARLSVRLIQAPRGLTRQRNVGLAAATSNLICFLDDDVTFAPDFLSRAASVFSKPEAGRVGGITGYDSLNYSAPVTLRWRLRKLLKTIPSLKPGDTDRLGQAVTVSFLKPWSGHRRIGWLPGFCMIYRRESIEGLRFDENLPTYGGEDREFSMRVAERWDLWICGDLLVRHHGEPAGRDSHLGRVFQTGFGAGRRFSKSVCTMHDRLAMIRTILGESVVDVVAFWVNPSYPTFMTVFARNRGFAAGWFSYDRRACRIISREGLAIDADNQRAAGAK